MTLFTLYLVSILDALNGFFIGIDVACASALFGCIIISMADASFERTWPIIKKFIWIIIISSSLLILTPSTKSALFIIGANELVEISKTDKAKSIASKSALVVEKFLDEQLNKRENKK